ncbi:unnamed protein product [Lepeophtheirus salmonis]|uniref:(salmon louse) hypothetical protein n=1 Tax=Lepeophtheirus salmonis TaxID=72036 RepID=A0A7R8CS19_LEPSM|nr:unnamed protein product [Lepeophtheirus salmonis]CAF2912090.1 unnamed protein product [Lepeophtheirus salmonis]
MINDLPKHLGFFIFPEEGLIALSDAFLADVPMFEEIFCCMHKEEVYKNPRVLDRLIEAIKLKFGGQYPLDILKCNAKTPTGVRIKALNIKLKSKTSYIYFIQMIMILKACSKRT